MSDLGTLTPMLAGAAAIVTVVAGYVGYLLYRQKEIIALAKELFNASEAVINAYKDKNVSEEEFEYIMKSLVSVAEKLKAVIYKK